MEAIPAQRTPFVEVSAPGKLIISGEHSVVYGKNALCAALDLRCRCTGFTGGAPTGSICFNLKNLSQSITVDIAALKEALLGKDDIENYSDFLKSLNMGGCEATLYNYKIFKAFRAARHRLQEQDNTKIYQGLASQGYSFDIDSTIPVGKGLGSSAATSVSTASALLCLFDKLSVGQRLHEDLQLVNTIAFEYERVYHSNPSGVDNYVSCNGGLVVFNRTSKDYKRLEWPFVDLSILLIDSEVEKNTKKAVEHVRFLYNNQNGKEIIESIAATTDKVLVSIEQKDEASFLSHIRLNHELLKQLGLSNEPIQKIVGEYSTADSSAKITGAGMGGYVVVFNRKPPVGSQAMSISSTGLSVKSIN